ncbi:hypothetical protein [Thermocoleostomius sinensis]|uniref:Uncharacterized protein n=1 Tax=Thermocoleostomius sinensis A174 TaxID=2016057 RepID=A0A9E8ZGF4_9CYAN|nr:hypothetical protein [Thermocoleostomius sinensis]WAL62683.1 hypothetical protein OXH18_12030 [Thermocoleostomius sinensis A174]
MASSDQVKRYLAYWFQLGKPLVLNDGQETLLPQPVLQNNHYSPEFEACWNRVLEFDGHRCYLEGTSQSIHELLSSQWEIESCARCAMPVPMVSLGAQTLDCPCNDLNTWPNNELPQPRSPIDSQAQLNQIRDRLLKRATSPVPSPATPRKAE